LFCNFQELHGYEEYKAIEKARDAMFDVAEYANEVKRDKETLLIIRQIEVGTFSNVSRDYRSAVMKL